MVSVNETQKKVCKCQKDQSQLMEELMVKAKKKFAEEREGFELAKKMMNLTQNKLEEYKKDRNQLFYREIGECNYDSSLINNQDQWFHSNKHNHPLDADGIYMVVDGFARLQNTFDIKIEPGENFGGSKFLFTQGYSYFGEITAYKQPEEDSKLKVKSTTLMSQQSRLKVQ